MHWQVLNTETGEKSYIDPEVYNLEMLECKLHNRKGVALSILKGGEKNVCSWVACDQIIKTQRADREDSSRGIGIRFNPREIPHWHYENGDRRIDLDNATFKKLGSVGRKLFILP